MKDYNSRLLAWTDLKEYDNQIIFDIPKLNAYIKEQKRKGRKSEDITLDEIKHLIVRNIDKI